MLKNMQRFCWMTSGPFPQDHGISWITLEQTAMTLPSRRLQKLSPELLQDHTRYKMLPMRWKLVSRQKDHARNSPALKSKNKTSESDSKFEKNLFSTWIHWNIYYVNICHFSMKAWSGMSLINVFVWEEWSTNWLAKHVLLELRESDPRRSSVQLLGSKLGPRLDIKGA